MFKRFVIGIALALVASASFAQDLSSVGTHSTEITFGSSYAKTSGDDTSTTSLLGGVQLNYGQFGSFYVGGGDTRLQGMYPGLSADIDMGTFTVGYANGFWLSNKVHLVGFGSYSHASSDLDDYQGGVHVASGSLTQDGWTLGTEVQVPVTWYVRPFVGYSYSSANTSLILNTDPGYYFTNTGSTTEAIKTTDNINTISAGTYILAHNNFTVKVAANYSTSNDTNTYGASVGFAWKF